jgi:hypothetical protein
MPRLNKTESPAAKVVPLTLVKVRQGVEVDVPLLASLPAAQSM